ncbi:MAG: hypothetical protein PHW80_08470 [Smithellaceae bacterium]|jgi:heme-binding NEAT domain protein|nr:hypothetical protein [Smithellaceae bacterium]MDD3259745.1 hypothetical protein [Smithellaceae bacterium]MDD3849321.1 hypothetical protein [Smithellaceae bacterium]HOG11697.1 hypothetical protein [Smithellaceae bacterium]HOQ71629.1 hypothetical protein [Smithellaceae bacterium]
MKKVLVCAIGLVFLLAVFAFAAEKPGAHSAQKVVSKTATMNARGKVVEISDKAVRIERSIKGSAEIMEFALENPAPGIAVNDFVKIDYTIKDGKMTASRIAQPKAEKNHRKNETKQVKEKSAATAK